MIGNIVKAYYDNDTKTAHVIKNSKYGTFHCTATPHCDELAPSELTGFQIAELKCDLKIQREKAYAYSQRAIGIKHVYTILLQSGQDKNSPIMKKIKKALNIAQRDAENAYLKYNYTKNVRLPQFIKDINNYRYEIQKKQ